MILKKLACTANQRSALLRTKTDAQWTAMRCTRQDAAGTEQFALHCMTLSCNLLYCNASALHIAVGTGLNWT